jgi:aminoacrylate hydrolase
MPHATGLWYEWHGPEEGEVVILSPGLGGSADYWQPNLHAFAERFRVLLYDHRGTGRSDRTLPETTSVEAMAQDVLGLMEVLNISSAHFVGHALGGLIGMEIALMHAGRISRLVVVNGWLELDPHTARCFDVRLDLLRHAGAAAYLRAQPLFLFPPSWVSSHDEDLTRQADIQLAHFPDPASVEKRIAAAREYRIELIDLIASELLVIVAEDDMLVPPPAGRAIAAECYWAELVTMEWGGHACNVTDPARFNQITSAWLSAAPPQGA